MEPLRQSLGLRGGGRFASTDNMLGTRLTLDDIRRRQLVAVLFGLRREAIGTACISLTLQET